MTKQKKKRKISAAGFDRIFDEGKEDMTPYLNMSTAHHPGLTAKRINVDFPAWMVDSLDRQAKHLGVARQALIKLWIAERLDNQA